VKENTEIREKNVEQRVQHANINKLININNKHGPHWRDALTSIYSAVLSMHLFLSRCIFSYCTSFHETAGGTLVFIQKGIISIAFIQAYSRHPQGV